MAQNTAILEPITGKPCIFAGLGHRYDMPVYATSITWQPDVKFRRVQTTSGKQETLTEYKTRDNVRLVVNACPLDIIDWLHREWHRTPGGLREGKPFALFRDPSKFFLAPLESHVRDVYGGISEIVETSQRHLVVPDGKFYGAAAFPGLTRENRVNGTFEDGDTTGWNTSGTGMQKLGLQCPEWGEDEWCMQIGSSSSSGGPHQVSHDYDTGSGIGSMERFEIGFLARGAVEGAQLKVKVLTAPNLDTVIAEQTITLTREWQYYYYESGTVTTSDDVVRLFFILHSDNPDTGFAYLRNVTLWWESAAGETYGNARAGFGGGIHPRLGWLLYNDIVGDLFTQGGAEGTISFWAKVFQDQADLVPDDPADPCYFLRWGNLDIRVHNTTWANAPAVVQWNLHGGNTLTAGDGITSAWTATQPGQNDKWKFIAVTWQQKTSTNKSVVNVYVYDPDVGGGTRQEDTNNVPATAAERLGQLDGAASTSRGLFIPHNIPDDFVLAFNICQLRIDPVAQSTSVLDSWYSQGYGHPQERVWWTVRNNQKTFPAKRDPKTNTWTLDWNLVEVL